VLAGILILTFRPFSYGDRIKITDFHGVVMVGLVPTGPATPGAAAIGAAAAGQGDAPPGSGRSPKLGPSSSLGSRGGAERQPSAGSVSPGRMPGGCTAAVPIRPPDCAQPEIETRSAITAADLKESRIAHFPFLKAIWS
jgi:hypothetical protein